MTRRWSLLLVLPLLPLLSPTWAVTHASTTQGYHTIHTTAAEPVLRRGARGPAVRELQRRLTDWNYQTFTMELPDGFIDFLVIDGVFGRKVERFVREFQRWNNLTVDGIVGAQTWRRLPNLRGSERLDGVWSNRASIIYSFNLNITHGMLIDGQQSFTTTLVKESTSMVKFTAIDDKTQKKFSFTAQFRDQGGILLTAPGRRSELLYRIFVGGD